VAGDVLDPSSLQSIGSQLESAYRGDDSRPLLALMFDMKIVAQKLTITPIPGSNPQRYAAPTFEWQA
jgi:hypothetical protein